MLKHLVESSSFRNAVSGSRNKQNRANRQRQRGLEALEVRAMMAAADVPAGFDVSEVANGFYLPTSMAVAPDGRIFVTEKGGDVKIIKDGQVLATPFLTVPANTYSERGLESIVFDPNFEQNGYVYVYYTHASPIANRLSRFTVSNTNPDRADPNSEVVLLGNIPATGGLHNGGSMHFGNDGMLYLGIGDALVETNVQDMGSLSGKILRLNVSNPNNIVPSDNPFVNTPGARPEIFALGFRNPYTSAIQPSTGKLFVNDVGAATWEEVNYVQAGKNYGWPGTEGATNNPNYTSPIYAFNHNGGDAAVTGGVFYEANQFPSNYFGNYFFSNFVSGEIFRLNPANNQVTLFATNSSTTVDFDVAADGSLYYLNLGDGAVYQIRYVGSGNRMPTAVATSDKTYGMGPLTVGFSASQSSDPDGDNLTYTWNFGDGSPIVTGRDVSHTYTSNGIYSARVTVNDGRGGVVSSSPLKIAVGETPPTATILQPVVAQRYAAGDVITFAGIGLDAQDGTLSADAFSWTIRFYHGTHSHPFMGPIDDISSGTFTVPNLGETAANVWYRVTLNVTDSAGLTSTTYVDVFPELTDFKLETNIPGLTLTLDGAAVNAGTVTQGVVGITRTLGAPAFQVLPTGIYLFDSWSDGGTSIHTVNVASGNPTYTANYVKVEGNFDNFYYIQDLYQKLLKRDPSAEELKAAVADLQNGLSRRELADTVYNSVEHRGRQVDEMYRNYLDREPAPGERNVLVQAMRNGMTEGDAALTLVNGPEYVFRINININEVILDYMYQDILNRNPDGAGRKEYLGKLNNGSMSRAQVAQTLMNSDEHRLQVIDKLYVELLGRPADNYGRQFYLGQLKSGALTERTLATALVSSDEAIRKSVLQRVDGQNVDYVNSIYQMLQGRTADISGLAQFATELNTGVSRIETVQAVWNSPEYLGKIVDKLYNTYLRRNADAGGRANWVNALQSGMSEDDLTIAFLTSGEYANRFGNGNQAFVDSLYKDILGRTADKGGRDYWIGQLNAGMTRANLTLTFLTSTEKYAKVIDALYTQFLKRNADNYGRQYYLQQLQSGAINAWTLSQMLIASDEYFAKT